MEVSPSERAPPFSTAGSASCAGITLSVMAILFPSCSFSARGFLALVGPIAGGAIVLAAACALATSPVLAADQEPGAAVTPVPPAPMAAYANTELGKLLDSGSELVVAGKRLNVGLLRRFYARHGFEPVWTTRSAQANSLIDAVRRAGEHGLAPQLFHVNLLRSPTLPPLHRELLLSDTFLSYADALARGAVRLVLGSAAARRRLVFGTIFGMKEATA